MGYYQNLNPEQKKAVEFKQGPLLIIAGAGTGKTTVITERIGWLINNQKLNPDQILALTFTDKAAGEMEERVDKLLPYGYVDLWISTFHSFAQRILEQHGLDIGLPDDFRLLDNTQSWLLVRQNLEKFNLDYYRPLGNPTKFIHALIKHFSRCKDELVFSKDYLDYAEKLRLNADARQEEVVGLEIKRLEEVANAYHVYQQLLLDNNALDFGDLINYCLKLFKDRPQILEKYRQQFQYILVDEFQDTNYAQYELIKLLAEPKNNITVVGDDDQCLPPTALIATPSGQKQIRKIKVGDEILSAVGKGHVGISKVKKAVRNKRKAKILTILTNKGFKIQVTDNHKMFCHVPSAAKAGKWHYIYLMWRQDLGWRLGITKNLSWRLSLERSADKIVGIKACFSEEEARYYELLYSLKYSIPTYCFKNRKGLAIKDDRLKDLYKELDTEVGVRKLAEDLNIDLTSAHVYLDGVTRGKKDRVKINLNLCYRRYRSKHFVKSKREIIKDNLVQHEINLQTSNSKVIHNLEQCGFRLMKVKKGKRLRIVSRDLKDLGYVLKKLESITGGIVEAKANIGKLNYQHLTALVMPAKNLLVGHYLPIRMKGEIIYDEIVKITSKNKLMNVYDLEIERTHNFIANGIVVHNSIYKFRGASISNILEFKKDYPKAAEVFLNTNYRSQQNILDLAYKFIQLNNPNRLEVKLQIRNQKPVTSDQGTKIKNNIFTKELRSALSGKGIIEHLHEKTLAEEVATVVNKIQELYQPGNTQWSDFAILVRANDQANAFTAGLETAGLPYQFVASKGLYLKSVVMDVMAFLKMLDNYHESPAYFRLLSSPIINLESKDLINLSHLANKKSWSLYETSRQFAGLIRVSEKSQKAIERIVSLIEKHTSLAKEKSVAKVVLSFLEESGYLKWIDKQAEQKKRETFNYLGQFYKSIKDFEQANDDKSIKSYLNNLELELEAGEQGSLQPLLEEAGPETIKVMTVHQAKGLEFKYVFLVNLVDRRFPTTERSEAIELPNELVKEIIPEGDIHLQEERRLFYVGLTRAKEGLFFTSADDYGGQRKKKLSRFLGEIGIGREQQAGLSAAQQSSAKFSVRGKEKKTLEKIKEHQEQQAGPAATWELLPVKFSFTQLKAFETCPLQYKYAHILKIPVKGKGQFSFGKTMHNTLLKLFQLVKERSESKQADLFGKSAPPTHSPSLVVRRAGKSVKSVKSVSLDELIKLYETNWIDDWYESKSHQEEYFKKGKEILKEFYNHLPEPMIIPQFLEKPFNVKIGEQTLKGVIDRVDKLNDGTIEIIDYKTGRPKEEEKLSLDDKKQLLIYQMAATDVLKEKVSKLTFYYLDNNTPLSFLGDDKELEKIKNKITEEIKQIMATDFTADAKIATPSEHKCKFCDFKDVCEFKII